MIDLRHGEWQRVLADVECDALICDPPYSDRTHQGQRTGSSIRMPTIGYGAITRDGCHELAQSWSQRTKHWAVIFCDHKAFSWHEEAWLEAGWLTFAPVFCKENPPPRFSGDGPAFGLEFMLVARRRSKSVRPIRSLPAYYPFQVGGDRATRTVAGAKDLGLMQAIVSDYTEPGALVCDPFAGGGTTLRACQLQGRNAIGAERMYASAEIAAARISQSFTPATLFDGLDGTQEPLLLGACGT